MRIRALIDNDDGYRQLPRAAHWRMGRAAKATLASLLAIGVLVAFGYVMAAA